MSGGSSTVRRFIGGRRGAERVRATLELQSHRVSADCAIDAVRRNRVVEFPGAVVAHGAEEGAFGIGGTPGFIEIIIQELFRAGVQGHGASLVAFAMHLQVWDARV